MKRERLTPTIILLILSMLVGFSLLYKLSKPSVLVAAVLGLVVIGMSVVLLVQAVKFDRQTRGREKRNEESAKK
ncbi:MULTISPECIES: hypothetical protein [Sphaerochaeta]|jgi:nucleoside recognition membrane protein YjiH|uniref:Uncharacterized protein n=1 Tax=Sphaerochaeta associata TaxID=1129264 RepID=A0ABY4DGB6_9SPIR|nr:MULTISPECIES: hypothetical protein [Sphaerochaeta]MDT3358374.1 hypothetical protein [Spirochaetota bacterium]NLA97628.1 hypothetical protein [Spirochaetales bacterium]MDD2394870.1 hypothetical protein [Sphaerochaeta sp.]MDD3424022.1 hypothetical protein [Sphaerochaeta sp.]MDD3456745.1 hypothetical protein [Sphaerochaeta sp.]